MRENDESNKWETNEEEGESTVKVLEHHTNASVAIVVHIGLSHQLVAR